MAIIAECGKAKLARLRFGFENLRTGMGGWSKLERRLKVQGLSSLRALVEGRSEDCGKRVVLWLLLCWRVG